MYGHEKNVQATDEGRSCMGRIEYPEEWDADIREATLIDVNRWLGPFSAWRRGHHEKAKKTHEATVKLSYCDRPTDSIGRKRPTSGGLVNGFGDRG